MSLSNHLQYTYTYTLLIVDCRAIYDANGKLNIAQPENLCAFTQSVQGTCIADAGSPLVIDNVLVGITSWTNCKLYLPDLFTQIAAHKDWIVQNTY